MTDIADRIGPEWGTLTPAQHDALTRLDADLSTRKPVLDIELRTAALRAVVQRWLTSESTWEDMEETQEEQDRALAGRIGPEWDLLGPTRRETLRRLDTGLSARKPVLDIELRTAALRAVVQYWRGELTVESAGEAVEAARKEQARAFAVARALGVAALEEGGQQSEVARTLSVDRQGLLRWAGLRD